mmetsp:Transcript_7923/g.13406  ORF Transcript_7923/g.13406 Transcript_7923/m.13406 type:complete len:207 (+) Transcript_7923:2-622(+)
MLVHIESQANRQEALPGSVTSARLHAEVEWMHSRMDALKLPVVCGHGDLKPSNVMAADIREGHNGACCEFEDERRISFIDFELGGMHYRGYDLYKLFRTTGEMSLQNLRCFLIEYLSADTSARGQKRERHQQAELDELCAETLLFQPISWLEAAIFFFFAISTYPSEKEKWAALALDRWERYVASAHLIDIDGDATRALLSARQQN